MYKSLIVFFIIFVLTVLAIKVILKISMVLKSKTERERQIGTHMNFNNGNHQNERRDALPIDSERTNNANTDRNGNRLNTTARLLNLEEEGRGFPAICEINLKNTDFVKNGSK